MKDHNIARQKQKIEWQQQRVRNIGFNLFVLRLLLFGQLRSLKLVTANLVILDSLLVHLFWQKLHLLWMAILQDRNRKLSDNNKGSEILASELFQAFFSFVSFFLATLALWKSPECRNGWPGFSSGKLPTTLSKAGGKRNVKNPAAQN